jgi:hypothetical protein
MRQKFSQGPLIFYNNLFNECLICTRISSTTNLNIKFVILLLGRETKTLQDCEIGHSKGGAAKEAVLMVCYIMLTSKQISNFRTNIPLHFFRVY